MLDTLCEFFDILTNPAWHIPPMLHLTDELTEAKDLAGAEFTRASMFANLEDCVSTRDDRFWIRRDPC